MPTTPRTSPQPATLPLDVDALRAQFPLLARRVHDRPLVYLDNAATSQKPLAVIDAIDRYYRTYNANVHRGIHTLAEEATAEYDGVRIKVRRYLGAEDDRQIVFTRGTTEAINLVAQSYARSVLRPGDRVLITHLEHHSNIVPWQLVCAATGAALDVAAVTDAGEIDLDDFAGKLTDRTRIVSVAHVSNTLGTINPVKRLASMAHDAGAVVVVDGAQAAPHGPIDVRDLGADFYAISGHKVFGPTGVGVLCGRLDLLEAMPPWQGGGDMIRSVSFENTTYADPPYRFEAGTPNIAGVIGLGAALDWLDTLDWPAVAAHERSLRDHAAARLVGIPGLRVIGTSPHKAPIFSFILQGVASYDAAMILDRHGVAVRIGHHCTEPLMRRFGLNETLRASATFYNTHAEIDTLADAIVKAQRMLA